MRDLGLEVTRTTPASASARPRGTSTREEAGRGHAALLLRASRHGSSRGRIDPVVEDRPQRAGTILGADNKAAVAVMLEATRDSSPRTGSTAASSSSSRRRRKWACSGRLPSTTSGAPRPIGYVYDQAAPIGEVILGAPHAHSMEVKFHGRAAHAVYESGGRPVGDRCGGGCRRLQAWGGSTRIDRERRADQGGTAGNIILEWCVRPRRGRSHDSASSPTSSARCSRQPLPRARECEVESRSQDLQRLPLQR